jgi:hypothetical protein
VKAYRENLLRKPTAKAYRRTLSGTFNLNNEEAESLARKKTEAKLLAHDKIFHSKQRVADAYLYKVRSKNLRPS